MEVEWEGRGVCLIPCDDLGCLAGVDVWNCCVRAGVEGMLDNDCAADVQMLVVYMVYA